MRILLLTSIEEIRRITCGRTLGNHLERALLIVLKAIAGAVALLIEVVSR